MDTVKRKGSFSSSQIHRLMTPGERPMTKEELSKRPKSGKGSRTTKVKDYKVLDDTALNYVKEKKREKLLCRSINSAAYTRPMIWGLIMERYVFEKKLGTGYKDMNNADRLEHPEAKSNGIPDFLYGEVGVDSVVCEMKAPTSYVKFCEYLENTKSLATFKENHKDHYWQIVHNAILTYSDQAEFIWYVPYASELPKIQDYVETLDVEKLPQNINQFSIKWIQDEIFEFRECGKEPTLPYLPNETTVKDFNIFKFTVPAEDKKLLTERVKMAQKILEA